MISLFRNTYHPLYSRYVGWSFVTNVAVSMQTVITTNSMLGTITGCEETAKTLNYIGKDIIGQLGCLYYVSKTAKKVDEDPHKFLRKSHVLQQSSYYVIMASSYFSDYFLYIAGAANILTNVSFIGYGAINAKIIQKISTKENIGEIYSKITIINTLSSSIGLALGIATIAFVPSYTIRLCLVPILGIIRIYSYNRSVKDLI